MGGAPASGEGSGCRRPALQKGRVLSQSKQIPGERRRRDGSGRGASLQSAVIIPGAGVFSKVPRGLVVWADGGRAGVAEVVNGS